MKRDTWDKRWYCAAVLNKVVSYLPRPNDAPSQMRPQSAAAEGGGATADMRFVSADVRSW